MTRHGPDVDQPHANMDSIDPVIAKAALDGLAGAAQTDVGLAVYRDLFQPSFRELGRIGEETTKALHLLLAPIQYLAPLQDRFAVWCRAVAGKVPDERRIPASPAIVGPLLMQLRFAEEDNILTEMCVELLARSIDKERVGEAHPSFVRIVAELAPDEAILLFCLFRGRPVFRTNGQPNLPNFPHEEFLGRLGKPDWFPHYIDHLFMLGLLGVGGCMTPWGRLFCEACMPDELPTAAPSA